MKFVSAFSFALSLAILTYLFLSLPEGLLRKRKGKKKPFSPYEPPLPWTFLGLPAAALGYIIMAFTTQNPFLGTLGLSGFFLPRLIRTYIRKRRQREINHELSEFLFHLKGMLSFSPGLRPALEKSCSLLPPGIVKERLSIHLASSLSGEEVLKNLASDFQSPILSELLLRMKAAQEGGIKLEEAAAASSSSLAAEIYRTAEYRIKTSGVYLLLPILFFFIPPIFILGFFPLVSRILNILTGMK